MESALGTDKNIAEILNSREHLEIISKQNLYFLFLDNIDKCSNSKSYLSIVNYLKDKWYDDILGFLYKDDVESLKIYTLSITPKLSKPYIVSKNILNNL